MASETPTELTGRERLAQWIERSKLNQVEAARIIGIDPTQLSQILVGKRRPGLDNAVKIEAKTGIVVEAWVPIADDETPEPDPAPRRKSRIGKV
jgi:transcriptional regulator with XRE-family HTH domain